ncbi:MAG: hypothetical protein RBT24_06350 [Arcobacteraceae bacterium]|jgi:hypothetical protein|nr:hypothetical protein [Arcobacteraceae bacterium]
MTIHQKIIKTLDGINNIILTRQEILSMILKKYPDTNKDSITIQDFCYNRINKGSRKNPVFEFCHNGKYVYLGENYLYTGDIYWHKNKIGCWDNGKKTIFK